MRFPDEPIALIGFRKHVMETREPLMIDETRPEIAERYGNPSSPRASRCARALRPARRRWSRDRGISLQNLDRKHAFSDADQRLLTTLAGSLSVALENARLIHETRQRNAELALINSVQAALAGELELQAIYDVVGDKIQEIFDAQVVDIAIYDEATDLVHFPYTIERGVRFPDEPMELIGFRRHVMETREPLLISEDVESPAERYGNPLLSGEALEVGPLRAPDRRRQRDRRDLAAERRPRVRVQRLRPAAARDPRQQPERRARERPPRPRDPAAQRRAGADQQRAGRASPANSIRSRSTT